MRLNQTFLETTVRTVRFEGLPVDLAGSWCVDSRLVQAGDVFVGIQGSHVDGGTFLKDAFERGARTAFVNAHVWQTISAAISSFLTQRSVVIVEDTYAALLQLAAAWRAQYTYPVIGVTGSVGKTTTKELIADIFQEAGHACIASYTNQNTLLGAALTIMRMRPEHEYAIFEMGISRRGEMAELVKLVQPTTAVITALGHSHMEGLGSLADIAAEKRLIFTYLKPDGVGIVNGDQPLLAKIAYAHPVIKFGCKTINQIQARQIQATAKGLHFILKIYQERYAVALPTENMSRVYNVLAAAAVGSLFHIPGAVMVKVMERHTIVPHRFEKRFLGSTKQVLIDDSYNANPESMKAALLAFEHIESPGKKIAVLGDMLELGVNTPFWHRQLGRFLRKIPSLTHVIFVGTHMRWAHKTAPYALSYVLCPTWQDAEAEVRKHIANAEYCMLVKASRGVGLHQLVNALVDAAS